MSQLLREFLSAYRDWVDAGAVEHDCFSRSTGLCSNFEDWLVDRGMPWSEAEDQVDRLVGQFHAEGLDKHYPFGGEGVYYLALECDEQHLNESRIQWVRSKVAQVEVV